VCVCFCVCVYVCVFARVCVLLLCFIPTQESVVRSTLVGRKEPRTSSALEQVLGIGS
jgi:hypothetical protein